jgi:predicted YcjX-like family ATPase
MPLNRSTLAEIQRKIIKRGKRNALSRLFHAKIDKETIAAWKSDLNKILLVFNVRSVVVMWLLFTAHRSPPD